VKIAVAAKGRDLDSETCGRFGFCPYILVIDLETMEYEAIPTESLGKREEPAKVLASILGLGVEAIIVGFMSPRLLAPLTGKGFDVVTGVSGKVGEVVEAYRKKKLGSAIFEIPASRKKTRQEIRWALRTTGKEFLSIIPVLVSVILLVGLCETFINRKFLLSIFSGHPLKDSFMGALWGSILIGNPVNSYVIGDMLLKNGVSLYAVAAFLTTWVTVGLIQLPVEIETLGVRFAISRTLASIVVSILVAIITTVIIGAF